MEKGIYVATDYNTLIEASTFKVYNSAGEEVEGVSVNVAAQKFSSGVVVPYGGYLEISVNSDYHIDIYYHGILMWQLSGGYTYKIKIVDNILMKSSKTTNQSNAPT